MLLLRLIAEGLVVSASLYMSPCSSDYIIPEDIGIWRVVSEDSEFRIFEYETANSSVFPADCLHHADYHWRLNRKRFGRRVPVDTQVFQHIARFY